MDEARGGSRDGGATARVSEIEVTRSVGSGVAVAAPSAGATIGRYVVLEEAGHGGMARVMRSYDPRLQREVALKILRHAGDADNRARIVREARAMAQLSHPHVVAVFDVDEATADGETFVFVAMEYVTGQTLARWLKTRRPWRQVLAIFMEVGGALAAAHSIGLVHRDVKPSNVLVSDDGHAKIGDFGLAWDPLESTCRHASLSIL